MKGIDNVFLSFLLLLYPLHLIKFVQSFYHNHEKNLSYKYNILHCPTAAAACFIFIVDGRVFIFNLFAPTAIAPEEKQV